MSEMNSEKPIIECLNLTKAYENHFVFKNANCKTGSGITGLVAPNGYGKTTFIEMCVGVRKNYTGNINILGKSPDYVKNSIGFVPDKPSYPANIKVGDYIELVNEIYGRKPDYNMIQLANIEKVMDLKIGELSAGYLKRVSFLLAITHSPKIVFADEPFSNVDKYAVSIMLKMIMDLKNSGISFIISSHDLSELASIADRVLIINENKFKELYPRKLELRIIQISSENNELLYELLKNYFEAEITANGLIVKFDNLNKLLRLLSTFDKEIYSLKILDRRESFLDEINKAITED